jgi:tRNA pseudouridine38-40 synthase
MLEAALLQISGRHCPVTGSGRTDSGVHATGQVISFELAWPHGVDALQRAMNAHLPPDIAVQACRPAPAGFHPRFSARWRMYEYLIFNHPQRSPLRRHRSWHVRRALDLERMKAAAALLPGVRDFATFGTPPQGNNTVRELFRADWQQQGEYLKFTVQANAFLYRMVRSLVSSLKAVGDGSWTVTDFQQALSACDRRRAAGTAPAHGLYLIKVDYNGF